jgi:hypothetical protein
MRNLRETNDGWAAFVEVLESYGWITIDARRRP